MIILKGVLSTCNVSSIRFLSLQKPRLDRFTRDSLRSRIQKQEAKYQAKAPPQDGVILADSVPIRPPRDLIKATAFTIGVGVVSYSIASVVQWENHKTLMKDHFASGFFKSLEGPEKEFKLSAGEKCALFLVVVNCAVTLLWRVKALQPSMWRYFSNSYASKSLCAPMVLSAFSHSSFIHLGLNLYVLWTFAQASIDKFLGTEQFAAFYTTAAAVSSLTSLMHKSLVRSPIRALGASGAILGVLTYTCCKIPDARLRIVFIPAFDFSAESAVIGIILFDFAGLVFRFRLFDHAAHLGGALFGVWYAKWGEEQIWGKWRKDVQRRWHYMTRID